MHDQIVQVHGNRKDLPRAIFSQIAAEHPSGSRTQAGTGQRGHCAGYLTRRVPPGNRLEALTHDRQGQHSIRVNNQWRVCFVWRDGDAYDVEIVDYH